jgi:hypothetical protein
MLFKIPEDNPVLALDKEKKQSYQHYYIIVYAISLQV